MLFDSSASPFMRSSVGLVYLFICIEPDVYHISLLVYNKIIQKSFMKNVIQMSSDFRKRI
jgi:hypothetical protein